MSLWFKGLGCSWNAKWIGGGGGGRNSSNSHSMWGGIFHCCRHWHIDKNSAAYGSITPLNPKPEALNHSRKSSRPELQQTRTW